ncbi:bifunctional YncE family protein/alkaline phosphatase family protein [Luteipulveratus sp. YIM 133132]|uniref:bifunctional YncE family protein/alkaline phosphatase family protein n=1 Tax=Luteipulveratus flavus TaxID=3031728 RepID=UPI0023B0A77B|nr:bifunctional YncE family protein/alkaline phosphatase family protein [Luteipulveratus sp. YIM 133132]MDE9364814.1 bifunctional YncE family protein/alkaline phosphatase family protein [Luteipulveratus sp. YIM 133132]
MHVTRQRRSGGDARRLATPRRLRVLGATTAVLTLAGGGLAYASTDVFGNQQVGTEYADGIQVSGDQVVKPLGERLLTTEGKYMRSGLSPDGRFLAATSTDRNVALQIVDLSTYKVVWRVGKAAGVDQKLSDVSVGQEAPTYSPDGRTLWLPQKDGFTRFVVKDDGTLGAATPVPLAKAGSTSALPAGSVFSADGGTLYVAVNGQNKVVALDPATGTVKQTWTVGTAPRQIAVVGGRLYVSNEGGRPAKPGETTINSYGTQVPANPVLGTSTTGTLSVIDTANPSATVRSIDVGLHPTALLAKGNALFVANTNSDTVSVVDTAKDRVVQTITTQPGPSSRVGYAPNGLALTADGHLLVTLGRANAVAVFRYAGRPQEPVSAIGLLPTDYYPATVATTGGKVVVTNTRGIDARGPDVTINAGPGTTPATGHGTHSTTGSFTRFALPSDKDIRRSTRTVFAQNGWNKHDVEQARGHGARPVPVPRRVGDPSTIKHVFLLVKENRTYDQVYGDDARGNGDASLAQFGATVTPNQHALAKQFGLYDNLYDIGTNSAEGHNWLMQGDNPEYTESSAGEYTRSYDTEDDVLGHQRSGFLWTSVQAAHKTARNFGEFMQFETKPAGATWQKYYCAAKSVSEGGDPAQLTDPSIKQDTQSPIPSLNAISNHDYPKFDTDIPDTYRAEIWKQDFAKNGPANLNMFWLSSDHTGGTPDPRAQVADGDVAVGTIVDTISHSRYWKDSVIFVVEDDSQNGTDHVDGHRAPVQIISPWAKHGTVDHTYYSQLTVGRTIQQILGAQPLNQKLAAAAPMEGAFTTRPDFRPFTAVPHQVPLTEGVTPPPACGADTTGTPSAAAPEVPAAAKGVAAQWQAWSTRQRFTGNTAVPDYANPEQMNRYTWYRTHGWTTPYPGDAKVYAPTQVPGAYIPSTDTE